MNTFLELAIKNFRDEYGLPQPTVEPVERGPRECCAEFARVVENDGDTDRWSCPCCAWTWTAPCQHPTV